MGKTKLLVSALAVLATLTITSTPVKAEYLAMYTGPQGHIYAGYGTMFTGYNNSGRTRETFRTANNYDMFPGHNWCFRTQYGNFAVSDGQTLPCMRINVAPVAGSGGIVYAELYHQCPYNTISGPAYIATNGGYAHSWYFTPLDGTSTVSTVRNYTSTGWTNQNTTLAVTASGSQAGFSDLHMGYGIAHPHLYSSRASATSGEYTFLITQEGYYNPNVRAISRSGAGSAWYGADSANHDVQLDRTAPTLAITQDTTSWATAVQLTLTASDNNPYAVGGTSGVQYTQYLNSNGVWENIGSTYTITRNGTYNFRVLDYAGNVSGAYARTITNVDNVPPTVTGRSTGAKTKTDNFIVSATDTQTGVAKVGWSVTANSTVTWATGGTATFNNLLTDNKTYYAWAQDNTGNIASVAVPITNLDLYIPVINGISIEPGWGPSKAFNFDATDPLGPAAQDGVSGIKFYSAGTEIYINKLVPVKPVEHLTVSVIDVAGNTSAVRAVKVNTIDNVVPTIGKVSYYKQGDATKTDKTGLWINSDAYITFSDFTSKSGINSVSVVQNSQVKQTVDTKTLVKDTDNIGVTPARVTTTDISETSVILDRNGTYTVKATSHSGMLTNNSYTINIDKVKALLTVTADGSNTSGNINVVCNFNDPVDSTGVSGVSGVNRIRIGNNSWVDVKNKRMHTFVVTTNGVYTIELEDVAGNVTSHEETISAIDREPPDLVVEGNPTIWTNKTVEFTATATDRARNNYSASGASGIQAHGVWYNFTPNKETPIVRKFDVVRNGTYTVAARDAVNNITTQQIVVNRIDKVLPSTDWTEDIRKEQGKAIIYINAWDDASGIDYVLLPDGTKVEGQVLVVGQPAKVSTSFTITDNGIYRFEIYDVAGNMVTKTYTYDDLRHDYYVAEFDIVKPADAGADYPDYSSDFEVDVKWGNRDGEGKNVAIQIYAIDDAARKIILLQDTVSVKKGSDYTKRYTLNLDKTTGVTTLYAEIDPLNISTDLTPADNVKSIITKVVPLDYAITGPTPIGFYSPGQKVAIPVVVTGTGLGDAQNIPVELMINGTVISKTYVEIGRWKPSVELDILGTIPAGTKVGVNDIYIHVNRNNVSAESNTTNNRWGGKTNFYKEDLGLKFNTTIVVDGDTYSYPSASAKYDVVIGAVQAHEKIKSITTLGKTTTPNTNNVKVTLELDKQQIQAFKVIVISACGAYEKEYDIKVVRSNDNLDVDVVADIPTGPIKGVIDSTGNYTINLPVGTLTPQLKLDMVDLNANILIVDTATVDKSIYREQFTMALNSTRTFTVTVAAQDATRQKTFTIKVTNQNAIPTIKVINKTEIKGTTYALGGVLRNSVFSKYDKSITTVELAKRTGRTNGVVMEIEIKDSNEEQFLRGYVEIGTTKYPIHWNTFDGPTVIQSSQIITGYIYIDRTALRVDSPLTTYTVTVEDYKNSNESEVAISKASDTVQFAIDITGPIITATADSVSKSVTASATDAGSGLKDMQYRTSKNKGTTWTNFILFPGNVTVTESGLMYVEVQATDKAMNKSTTQLTLNITGPGTVVPGGVFSSTTRVADFTYINIRKNNSDTVAKEILDTFK